ncbi:hypothetical protein B0T16DRAFT_396034 [Cercophora newfieldiana]|uniref:F-box domain-containing protein n=1 Tax=Cercophora newfieldiana TaxID=92897 RepID=A0AA40CXB8_9PEZI|nr:hypothetical protein B0T16DRAFT_396034 [Cercophora newfieldiana]
MPLHLLHLPTEILVAIIDELGYDFFAQDARRLAVCRGWYAIALEALRDLRLTSPRLRLPCASAVLARAQPTLVSLDLDLEGGSEIENGRIALFILHRRLEKACPSLRRLRIKLGRNWDLPPLLRAIYSLLRKARDLTALDIDTAYYQETRLVELGFPQNLHSNLYLYRLHSVTPDLRTLRFNAKELESHLCDAINRLMLTSLRTLRCELHFMCEKLLELPQQAALPNLRQVVVELPGATLKTCRGRADGKTLRVIEEQLMALAQRMKEPLVVKLLAGGRLRGLDDGRFYEFDAIANMQGEVQGWSLNAEEAGEDEDGDDDDGDEGDDDDEDDEDGEYEDGEDEDMEDQDAFSGAAFSSSRGAE